MKTGHAVAGFYGANIVRAMGLDCRAGWPGYMR